MIFSASMPPGVRGITLVKNHFYVEVTDDDGNKAKLNADRLFVGTCIACRKKVIAYERSQQTHCSSCGKTDIEWDWDTPQLAFLPCESSSFISPRQKIRDVGIVSDQPSEGYLTTPSGPPEDKNQ